MLVLYDDKTLIILCLFQELNFDHYRSDMSVMTERNATSAQSFLIIQDVGRNSSGYYSCHYIDSKATIYVHVLEGIN